MNDSDRFILGSVNTAQLTSACH